MNAQELDFNSPEFLNDPYPIYTQLREKDGPSWLTLTDSGGGMWLFTRYEDVGTLLREARISKNVRSLPNPPSPTPLDRTMLFQDPPDHYRLRSLTNQVFTPSRIKRLEAEIEQIVDSLLTPLREQSEFDFITEFARPLPVIVIARMLGIPVEDQEVFRTWSNEIMLNADSIRSTEERFKRQQQAMYGLINYFTDLIRKRKGQPGEDILSGLITAHESGDRLSEEELLGTCILLLIAGHETTVNLLGNGMLTLLHYPDQAALLRANLDLLPSAVEEMLRFESPVQRGTFRFVGEPCEIGGKTFEKNAQVSAVIGAANRDPAQFPDPDRFDITRTPNRHLAFGLGIHFCLGSALARSEARIGFRRFFETFPRLSGKSEQPDWNANTLLRGLGSLRLHTGP